MGATVAGLFYGGVGALIGMGIDALSPGRRELIYRARPAGAAARVSVWPILLPQRRAVLARISF